MESLPSWIFYLAAAALGLELGGLATIFIQRWIDETPILKPLRSKCPACGTELGWRDTVPLLSYILLKGKCRHCEARIGGQYPLVELSCLAWALATAHAYGPTLDWAVHLLLGVMLIAGSFIDFETFLLPDRVTLGGTAVALVASFLLPESPRWQDALLGAAVGAGLFWLLQRGYRLVRKEEGLGTGDVKLMACIGAMTGMSGLPFAIAAASVTGLAASVVYMLKSSGQGMKTRIPFGPFLSLGGMLSVLYGRAVMRLFVNF